MTRCKAKTLIHCVSEEAKLIKSKNQVGSSQGRCKETVLAFGRTGVDDKDTAVQQASDAVVDSVMGAVMGDVGNVRYQSQGPSQSSINFLKGYEQRRSCFETSAAQVCRLTQTHISCQYDHSVY